MFSLEGKHVVITGGGSGIGLASAERLGAAGAAVTIIDRDDATARAEQIGARALRADVTDEVGLAEAIDESAAAHGRIDVLVASAGIAVEAPIAEVSRAQMQQSFDVNVLGVLFAIKRALSHMHAGGAIINLSSLAGLVGFPGYAAYSAAKSAVVSLTRAAALECGPLGIRVNCICPSSVDTPMLAAQPSGETEAMLVSAAAPLGRIVQPEEIAALVHFLAADDCAMISGLAVPVDGGITAGTSLGLIEAMMEANAQKAT
jgi:NAD(P)-dependent dehydrogenase (short-subunit alcohol dehydrogenase family)